MAKLSPSLIGQKFGRLTPEIELRKKNKRNENVIYYDCLCDCGNRKTVAKSSLKGGLTNSCGCIKKEKPGRTTHGKSKERVYGIWWSMVKRCTNPNCKSYTWYGAKGITVCEKWLKFEGFYEDMGDPPTRKHTIERIDVDKGYCKDNCTWIPSKQQARNKTTTVRITYDGQTLLADEWEKITGIPRRCIHDRIQRGWTAEEALTVPPKDGIAHRRGLVYKGERTTLAKLERERGFSQNTIYHRLKSGWTLEQAVETPKGGYRYETVLE